jgi:hypothetical protein
MVYDCRRLCLRLLIGARQLRLCRCKPDLPGLRPRDIPGVPDSRVVRGADRLYYVPTHHLGCRRRRDGRYDAAQRNRHPAAITVSHRRAGRL